MSLLFAEAYLGVLINVGSTLNRGIEKLQSEKSLVVNIYSIMSFLRSSLRIKLEQEFYGSIARNILIKSEDDRKKVQFKRQANAFLKRTIIYLEKWYQYDNNKFEKLSCMILNSDKELNLNDYFDVAPQFKITVDEDMLFEEFVQLRTFVKNVDNTDDADVK